MNLQVRLFLTYKKQKEKNKKLTNKIETSRHIWTGMKFQKTTKLFLKNLVYAQYYNVIKRNGPLLLNTFEPFNKTNSLFKIL